MAQLNQAQCYITRGEPYSLLYNCMSSITDDFLKARIKHIDPEQMREQTIKKDNKCTMWGMDMVMQRWTIAEHKIWINTPMSAVMEHVGRMRLDYFTEFYKGKKRKFILAAVGEKR